MKPELKAGIEYAKQQMFLPDFNFSGIIVEAQLTCEMCYGFIYGDVTGHYPDGTFIKFAPIGTDNRNCYNAIKTASGSLIIINEDSEFRPVTRYGFDAVKNHFIKMSA